jgi:hypothetical protein
MAAKNSGGWPTAPSSIRRDVGKYNFIGKGWRGDVISSKFVKWDARQKKCKKKVHRGMLKEEKEAIIS